MKERTFWIGILLAVFGIAGSYLYVQSHKIGEPIFLEHYIGETLYYTETDDLHGEVYLPFYYLTDKDEPWTVEGAEMNGITIYNENADGFFGVGEGINYEKEFGHQYLVKAAFNVPMETVFPDGLEEWAFTDTTFHFTNGKTVVADIGEVLVSRVKYEETALEHVTSSGTSNSDGESSSYGELVAEKGITIEGLTMPFKQRLGKDIALRISHLGTEQPVGELPEWLAGKPYSGDFATVGYLEGGFPPFEVKEGEKIRIKSEQNPLKGVHYSFEIGFEAKSESGKEEIDAIFVHHYPYLTEEDIDRIRTERKAGAAE